MNKIPLPAEPQTVTLNGSFADELTLIARTSANLHLMTGHLTDEEAGDARGRQVLVPFAEFRIGGGPAPEVLKLEDGADPPTLVHATVTLENMAFMVLDLANDLRRVCSDAAQLVGGPLAVDSVRLSQTRYFVANLEREAAICRSKLDAALVGLEGGDPEGMGQTQFDPAERGDRRSNP